MVRRAETGRSTIGVRRIAHQPGVRCHVEYRGLPGAIGERRDRGVQPRDPQLQRLQIDQRGEPRRAVRMQFHRHAVCILDQHRKQGARAVHGQEAALVLEVDRIGPERDDFACLLR